MVSHTDIPSIEPELDYFPFNLPTGSHFIEVLLFSVSKPSGRKVAPYWGRGYLL